MKTLISLLLVASALACHGQLYETGTNLVVRGNQTNAGNIQGATFTGNGAAITGIAAGNVSSGTLPAAQMPALTGAITTSAGAVATSLGSFTGAQLGTAISSGIIPIAKLATGTPNGTQFVRDDGALATPSSGGSALSWNTNGNDSGTAGFFGTTNLSDIRFKANNGSHGQIGTNGDIFFGTNNVATGTDTFTGGGQSNTNNAILGVIGGGHKNMIKGTGASGGKYNTIGGGQFNIIWSGLNWATICGGQQNTISTNGVNLSDNSFIGGGFSSLIESSARTSIVGGGWNAATNANDGFIGGGTGNRLVTGFNSVIPGGLSNSVSGNYSFAAGAFANVTHANSFLWADSLGTYASLANDSFGIRAQGGMFLHSGGLAVGGTTAQTAGNILATNNVTAQGQFNGNAAGLTNGLGYTIILSSSANQSPAQNATYFFGVCPLTTLNTTYGICSAYVPRGGKIKTVWYWVQVGGTAGTTGQAPVHSIRVNNTTDCGSSTFEWNQTVTNVAVTGVSQAVAAGDTIAWKIATPVTWTTTPTTCRIYCMVYIE